MNPSKRYESVWAAIAPVGSEIAIASVGNGVTGRSRFHVELSCDRNSVCASYFV